MTADHGNGEFTFLFTDVEGSTRFWVREPERAATAFARHDEILSTAINGAGGRVVKGTGDGFLAVFDAPGDALDAAIGGQKALTSARQQLGAASSVRMAIHTGPATERDGDFFGVGVIVCSRLMGTAHGGQVLVSRQTRDHLASLPEGVDLTDLGNHRLRDVASAERVFQLSHPDLAGEFPPIRALPAVTMSLPDQLTSFVGRSEELTRVESLLAESRLVTLTGSGGVGKTRLALQAATRGAERFPDGVWFVELASIGDEALVPQQVASQLPISDRSGAPPTERLSEFLGDHRTLLILDNCEHVLSSCAQLADSLLRSSPGLTILATSRERLSVPGEATYRVPPMGVPEAVGHEAEAVGHFDSVKLFAQRAALSSPGFSVTSENAEAVAAICRRLDGIPLAIELAAAKTAALSLTDLAERLDQRLSLLGGRAGVGPSNHETLRATVDWSYQLLDDNEKRLFDRLSVFRGGFDLPAVEAVCSHSSGPDAVALLLRLVDKSLVGRAADSDRYRLLETLRQYAAERLDAADETDDIALRHAAHYASVAQEANSALLGADQAARLDRLTTEHDNLRAAMAASLSLGEFAVAGRIAAEAWTFWKLRGHVAEGLRWLGSVLDHAETLEPGLHTDVLVGAGDLAIDTGDLGSAAQHLEAARALADERNDLSDAAAAVAKLASLPHKAGDIEGAISMGEQALAIAQEAGDDWVTGRILPSLALLHEDQGDHERAAELSREAVTVGRRSANPYLMADAALSAGEIALNSDDLANAQRLFEEAEASAESAGLGDVRAWALAYLGKLAVVKSEYRRARALLEQALSDFRELEAPMGASWALCHLGRALLGEGDPAAAKHRLEEGLDLATVYVRPDVPIALESLGIVAAEAGDPERAAVLLGAAEAIRDSIGLTLAAREQRESTEARDAIRGELGSQQAAELLDQGRSMSIDDAAAFVLKR